MDSNIELIISEGDSQALENFLQTAEKTFNFPELNHCNLRENLWKALYNKAKSTHDPQILINSFSAIRILSREKTHLNELASDDWLDLIKVHSGLNDVNYTFDDNKLQVAIEAQKCLCNVVFNSIVAASLCCQNGILDGIIERVKKYKEKPCPDDIKFFDMKLLFLLTALCSEIRGKVQEELSYFLDSLDLILKEAAENLPPNSDQLVTSEIKLSDKQVDLVCEILKALFNLTLTCESDEDEKAKYAQLVSILRIYLLIPTHSKEKTMLLQNNIVNLLTNMPNDCYINLITPVSEGQNVSNKLQYEGQNMTALYEILIFLKEKFSDEPTVSKQHEILSPVVSLLLKCANSERTIRKYLRSQILPPLRDVHSRPEQGTTLRNCLCRLLTTPITQLRDLVAELLFVLCKKNVNRMIKYTGYGNAAGLFAQRGLLGGRSDEGEADYSSDSGESETEEYAEYKHGINPVIGCYEAPHPSVMENMTEEQKEYEAMKLVELMDNLTKCGAIKPCRVGADGKPEPIEHVLQLREGLKSQQINNNDSDSD